MKLNYKDRQKLRDKIEYELMKKEMFNSTVDNIKEQIESIKIIQNEMM